MEEEWRDIKGYEGKYQVSNLGRVKSLKNCKGNYREKILKLGKDKLGYLQVVLSKEGKGKLFRVHRLVAESFIENTNNYPEVNHKDENKSNNCVDNLEWCDRKYNCNYGTRNIRRVRAQKGQNRPSIRGSKSPVSRKVQCITTGKKFNCITEAAKYYLLKNKENITRCCQGKRNYCGKHPVTGERLKWRYID